MTQEFKECTFLYPHILDTDSKIEIHEENTKYEMIYNVPFSEFLYVGLSMFGGFILGLIISILNPLTDPNSIEFTFQIIVTMLICMLLIGNFLFNVSQFFGGAWYSLRLIDSQGNNIFLLRSYQYIPFYSLLKGLRFKLEFYDSGKFQKQSYNVYFKSKHIRIFDNDKNPIQTITRSDINPVKGNHKELKKQYQAFNKDNNEIYSIKLRADGVAYGQMRTKATALESMIFYAISGLIIVKKWTLRPSAG